MTLIAIIICLLLEMFWQRLSAFRSYAWFPSYLGALQERFGGREWWHGPVGVSLALLILLLPVMLVHALVDDVWLGLPELLFGVIVLAASLRFQSLDRMIDRYMDAVDTSEAGAITDAAQAIHADAVGGAIVDGEEEGGRHVRDVTRAVLVFSNERLFAVLFWFVLLGPLGAVMYRVTSMLNSHIGVPAEHDLSQPAGFALSAQRLLQIMNWVPSRLLALTYGVSGSFEDALHEWQKYYADSSKPSLELGEDILAHAGCGALHLSRYEKSTGGGSEGDDEDAELEPEVVTSARGLVLRSLVTWCIVLALVTLSGWVS